MSYVIQNFYVPSRSIANTPRFKNFLLLANLTIFFLFLKNTRKLWFGEIEINVNFSFFILFVRYFFQFNLYKNLLKFDDKIWSNYTNNLNKSFIFWRFKFANSHFLNNKWGLVLIFNSNYLNFNTPLLSIKTNPLFLFKKFYKSIFFFKLFYIMQLWPDSTNDFKFNLNFIIITNYFHLFKFYNGPFFKIYNF